MLHFIGISLLLATGTLALVIPQHTKILILPGFGNESSDYFLSRFPEGSLVEQLKNRGWDGDGIRVLPLRRSDWLQVFTKGVFDDQFWKGQAPPFRPAFAWYLQNVAVCVRELTAQSKDTNTRVVIIGHSAGGWLARAALGYYGKQSKNTLKVAVQNRPPPEDEDLFSIDLDRIAGLVTLGAPHLPPPPQVMDMTRGALRLTHEDFPGAFHENLFYITVIGKALQGIPQSRKWPWEPTTVTGFAYNSYETVCGNGTTMGDGVVPLESAHLEGALQLNLEGVYHSINRPDFWYGSESVIDSWHHSLLEELAKKDKSMTSSQNLLGKQL